jgi:sn1-specific diacylglycerol lipase
MGSTPYFIIRDAPRKTVVLVVRGSSSYADLVTDLVEKAVEIKDWLPEEFVRSYNIDEAKAHGGILSSAHAILKDLDEHRILNTLLCGSPGNQASTALEHHHLLEERGIHCHGWNLVLCGHSLGAAVVSLLAPHIMQWLPETSTMKVWAFDPPGGFVTRSVADALRGIVTSVIVGKDSVSRTSSVTFERLQDQVVVSLARTRMSKLRYAAVDGCCHHVVISDNT